MKSLGSTIRSFKSLVEQLMGLPKDNISRDARPVVCIVNTLNNPIRVLFLEVEAPAAMTATMPIHRRPGRTLYRYLVLEMVFPTLYTLGGLTLVILTRELIGYSELVINRGVSLGDVAALALYQMLPVLSQMLPFAVLVGGLVALGRLGADRELLMLEASGVSSPRVVR